MPGKQGSSKFIKSCDRVFHAQAIQVRVIAVTFDRDLCHRTSLGSGIEFVRAQIHPGGFTMAPTAVFSETEVLTNQKTILQNQAFILKNQEEIKKNQETLNVIVKNQEKILAAVRH
jgi:hypothetical protein